MILSGGPLFRHTCGIYGFFNWSFVVLFNKFFVFKNLANCLYKIFVHKHIVVVYKTKYNIGGEYESK